jgi:transcriptional regulator with XRE-family HTH domain/Zn-dependent peptidase ImmA (M78 family)
MVDEPTSIGAKLRDVRERNGLSLRAVSRESGITSGYLSQLERGDVAQPTPSTLKRLADAYGLPIMTLMGWAGYETKESPVSPQLAKAMSYLGPEPSDREVAAIKAILDVLRNPSAGFSAPHPLDNTLHPDERKVIQDYALALLREADTLGTFPTPLDDLMAVAKLVYAGGITLTVNERRSLRARLGDRLDAAMNSLQGLITFGSREIWLAETLHPARRRFVHAHEIGHHILPVHAELAYLDNWETMSSQVRDACEREANQAAIELLAQGDKLRQIADDGLFGRQTVTALSIATDISLQATARRIAEESKRLCVTVTYYKGGGRLMPPHIYSSAEFEARFRWVATAPPYAELSEALRAAAVTLTSQTLACRDFKDRQVSLRCEAIDTPKALIGLVAKDPGGPLAKAIPMRRSVKLRSAA